MATQGMVTVREDSEDVKVLMKIVAGCNGNKAAKLAAALKESWPVSSEEAHGMAKLIGFGCNKCLVVITADDEYYIGPGVVHPRYRETFDQLRFNPRSDYGIGGHSNVVIV